MGEREQEDIDGTVDIEVVHHRIGPLHPGIAAARAGTRRAEGFRR